MPFMCLYNLNMGCYDIIDGNTRGDLEASPPEFARIILKLFYS